MNASTILVLLIIAVLMALALKSVIKQRKSGGCAGYSGDCGHCRAGEKK